MKDMRKQLKEVVYFGGLYSGKENEKLWREVKEYIEGRYDKEAIEKIYFQSDGGSWMKKGIEMLGGSYVVDEFHMKKYVKRMIRVTGEEGQGEEVMKYLERGERKKLREWGQEKGKGLEEKKAAGGKCRLPGKELEGDPNADKERRRSDGEQYGESYQSCAVSKDEFASDGVEQRGSRKAVRAENLLEEWKKGRRTAAGRKGGREERRRRERIQCPGCDKVGKEEPKEEWEICRSTTGDNKPSDRDEDVFSSSDNRDLWVRVRNGERGKSAHMDPQVKLHYHTAIRSCQWAEIRI